MRQTFARRLRRHRQGLRDATRDLAAAIPGTEAWADALAREIASSGRLYEVRLIRRLLRRDLVRGETAAPATVPATSEQALAHALLAAARENVRASRDFLDERIFPLRGKDARWNAEIPDVNRIALSALREALPNDAQAARSIRDVDAWIARVPEGNRERFASNWRDYVIMEWYSLVATRADVLAVVDRALEAVHG